MAWFTPLELPDNKYYIFGRDGLFLWFNDDLGAFADTFFSYFTYLAEGWIWIPYLLVLVLLLKKDAAFILINFSSNSILFNN